MNIAAIYIWLARGTFASWAICALWLLAASLASTPLSALSQASLRGGRCQTNAGVCTGASCTRNNVIPCARGGNNCKDGNGNYVGDGKACTANGTLVNATGAPQCAQSAQGDECIQQGQMNIMCLDYANCKCYEVEDGEYAGDIDCTQYDSDPNQDVLVNSCYSN